MAKEKKTVPFISLPINESSQVRSDALHFHFVVLNCSKQRYFNVVQLLSSAQVRCLKSLYKLILNKSKKKNDLMAR